MGEMPRPDATSPPMRRRNGRRSLAPGLIRSDKAACTKPHRRWRRWLRRPLKARTCASVKRRQELQIETAALSGAVRCREGAEPEGTPQARPLLTPDPHHDCVYIDSGGS